jgi:hypothetical protein
MLRNPLLTTYLRLRSLVIIPVTNTYLNAASGWCNDEDWYRGSLFSNLKS